MVPRNVNKGVAEARGYADNMVAILNEIAEGVAKLDKEVAEDVVAIKTNRVSATGSGTLTVPVVTIPLGQIWHLDRVTVETDAGTPVLTLDGFGALEAPYADDGANVFSFDTGYSLRGPATVLATVTAEDGDEMATLAMVRILGADLKA